jgi:hypothetical protein
LEGNGPAQITAIDVLDLNRQPLQDLTTGGSFVLRIRYELEQCCEIPSASFVVRFKNHMGVEVLRLSNTPISGFPIYNLSGRGQVDLLIPVVPFTEGQYSLDVGLARKGGGFYAEHLDVMSLYVRSCDVYNSGTALDFSRGVSVVPHRWIHQPESGQPTDSGWIGYQLLLLPQGCSQ